MKIYSLLPSGTEILFALGLESQIMGVTDLCDYPPEVREKPIVCRSKIDVNVMSSDEVDAMMHRILSAGESPYSLDQEMLQRHSPDVVLTQDLCYYCEIDAPTVNQAVRETSIEPKIVVLKPRTLQGIFDSIRQIGEACGAIESAASLIRSLEARLQVVLDGLQGVDARPKVFSLEGVNPLVIGGHWIPDLLSLAGGIQDLYPPGCAAARLAWEDVRAYAPEKLFIDLCSSDLKRHLNEIPWLVEQSGWGQIPAVRDGEVYLIEHVYLSTPGPRVIQGLEILAQLTHPEIFSGLIPGDTVLKLDPVRAKRHQPSNIKNCFFPFV